MQKLTSLDAIPDERLPEQILWTVKTPASEARLIQGNSRFSLNLRDTEGNPVTTGIGYITVESPSGRKRLYITDLALHPPLGDGDGDASTWVDNSWLVLPYYNIVISARCTQKIDVAASNFRLDVYPQPAPTEAEMQADSGETKLHLGPRNYVL